jgi:hypothetical protein
VAKFAPWSAGSIVGAGPYIMQTHSGTYCSKTPRRGAIHRALIYLIAGHYTVRVLTGRDESRPYDRVLTGRDESRPYDRYYSVCVIRHYDKCIRHNLLISRWYRHPTSLNQYAVIIQYHLPIHNIAKQTLPLPCAYRYEIRPGNGIIQFRH